MLSVLKLGDGAGRPASSQKGKRPRRPIACQSCRLRKVKCDGQRPRCHNCLTRSDNCVYARVQKRLPNSIPRPGSPHDISSLKDIELPRDSPGTGFTGSKSNFNQHYPQAPTFAPTSVMTSGSFTSQGQHSQSIPTDDHPQNGVDREDVFDVGLGGSRTAEQSRYPSPPTQETTSSIAPPEHEHWEYHGPGSYLSICSKLGVQWVIDQSGIRDFGDATRSFSREISYVLKLEQQLSSSRAPQPDEETSWQYTRVFFDEVPEAVFGIVVRRQFEARLRANWRDSRSSTEKDYNSEWYALRNVVWAFGARAVHGGSQYASTFIEASQAGTQYLENALSRLPDLLCGRCSLTAIEALILMALYAEGVGCQSIEYMLCSDALRLAYSKGLHRQPGTAWNIPPEEVEHRNTLFWVIYLYEKHIAYRSGRPSTIDDNDISCQLPSRLSPSSEFCWFVFRHAQISSQIAKRFHTVRAYSQSPDTCVKTVAELEAKLAQWKKLIPVKMQPGMVVDPAASPVHIHHLIYLHCAYYGSLISIHSIFTNPWSPIYAKCQTESLRKHVERSSNIVADASRNVILVTRYVNDMLAGTPMWLAMYYPILGLINLFIHVLRSPHVSTVTSDIALLDVVAGHLARLEFASGGKITFSFAREVSRISREAIRNAEMQRKVQKTQANPPLSSDIPTPSPFLIQDPLGTVVSQNQDIIANEMLEWDDNNLVDLDTINNNDIENWSALLPTFPLERFEPPGLYQPEQGIHSLNMEMSPPDE